MEILIGLLKELATTLSPTEFLFTLVIIAGAIFTIIKVILKNVKNPKGLVVALTGEEDTNTSDQVKSEIEKLHSEIRALNSTENFNTAMSRVINLIEVVKKENKDQDAEIAKQIHGLAFIKKDIETYSNNLEKEIEDISHSFKMHQVHAHQSSESIKEILLRGQDIMSRTLLQVEKLDEFIKNATIENKQTNREINREITELRKELALLERTVQTHINIDRSSAVTLR